MKTIFALAFCGLLACSTHPVETSVGGPAVSAPLAAPSPQGSLAATVPATRDSLPVPTPSGHALLLPDTPYDKLTGFSPQADMAAGREPSGAHPAGTVLVAEVVDGQSRPVTVTEWDLETKAAISHVTLPFRSEVSNARLLHAGEHVQVLAWAWNEDLHYVQLSTDLAIEATDDLGTVGVYGPSAIASDGMRTLIVVYGLMKGAAAQDEGAFFGIVYDARGHCGARRVLLPGASGRLTGGMRDNAVVRGDSLYTLESDGQSGLKVVERSADLRLRRAVNLPPKLYLDREDATLGVEGDQFFVSIRDPHAPDAYEIPFDLGKVTRRTLAALREFPGATACSRHVSLGDVRAALCWCGHSMCVAWDRTGDGTAR